MQVMQSSTALELGTGLPHSAALQSENGLSQESPDGRVTTKTLVGEVVAARRAEDADLVHDVGNLLSALELYAGLLALPGVLSEQYGEYAGDLQLLSQRSRDLMTRLIGWNDRSPEMEQTRSVGAAESGERSFLLVQAEAGWVPC